MLGYCTRPQVNPFSLRLDSWMFAPRAPQPVFLSFVGRQHLLKVMAVDFALPTKGI